MSYTPEFRCNFCGQTKAAQVSGTEGIFIPCQCEAARANQDRLHHEEMERRKQARTAAKVKKRGRR